MKKIIAVILGIGLISGSLFGIETAGNPSGTQKILIATERTSYKERLVSALLESLDDGNTLITIVNHQKEDLSLYSPEDFDAVLITNSGVQARVRPEVQSWLNAYPSDNIILHTTQRTNWEPSVEVDSVTSASKKSNINEVSAVLLEKIRQLF